MLDAAVVAVRAQCPAGAATYEGDAGDVVLVAPAPARDLASGHRWTQRHARRRSVGSHTRVQARMRRIGYAGAAVLVLLSLVGCGSSRHRSGPAKADFVVAADRICDSHLENVLTWLERLPGGRGWQQRSARDEGIYAIMGRTIQRLEALGPAPEPQAGSFTGYVRTLKARAALYRLTSMADLQRDRPFLRRLQRSLDEIDGIGDAAAHRYGLRICGASLSDLAARRFA
jgi:hypothetical protein